ncbi:DUF819 family protein [Arcticibacterium luteifluviistationis]|uniref:DUF819 domain-containing protein n=1 Tax=Arcticibacterium luteifluviistationis TaxID=1784714 RepID=A0A2Z4G8W9_9BACT|nr:DUF819 family protein [Arcticibacterium luteifluviistationis]AWV97508.1 hypothetical protein DJ013_04730 [Arcticibacterium luteifluviistationis]
MFKETLITNDAIVLGLLICLLYFVFDRNKNGGKPWQSFFKFFPPILLCYFLPGALNSLGIISGEESQIYPVVSRYLLPPCLLLFTLSLDIQMLKKLGIKAILVFLAGTVGVVIGGPIAVLIVKAISPETFSGVNSETWRGLSTVAGSWIGGGANQTALKEVFEPSAVLFSQSVAVDILIAETWLAILLLGVANKAKMNKFFGSNSDLIDEIKDKLEAESKEKTKIPVYEDYMKILAVGFGGTAIAYFCADLITPFISGNYPDLAKFSLTSSFFWVVVIVTLIGIGLSQTKVKEIEHVGATKLATVFLYILIASIGMQMSLVAIADNPMLFLVGFIWIVIHAVFIVVAGKLLKVPYFFVAVGSQANVGGAASASVVAAAFHPSLISVGVILSVLGYALGTYAGYLTTQLIRLASGQ